LTSNSSNDYAVSRKRNKSQAVAVSLFPFLAVLLCTMGGLIVLLVAMSHVSREQARAKQAEPPPPTPVVAVDPELRKQAEQRAEKLEQYNARLAELAKLDMQADEALRDQQLGLSQTESHIQRLTDKLASLRTAVAELVRADSQHYDDRNLAERNLKKLTKLIAETKSEIETLKEEQTGKSKSYAIVPYKGANGTRRKPIYIECTAGKVILRPEGVELSAKDFLRPLGVGNPLAAALRATREYNKRENPDAEFDPDAEPYPLILVRPDGVEEYYAVRAAIRTWDADFGYELVGSDWDLSFPAPNPELARQQHEAIARSRMRRAMMVRAAPSAYRGQGGGLASAAGAEQGSRGGGFDGQPYDGEILGQSSSHRKGAPSGSPGANPMLAQLDQTPIGGGLGRNGGPGSGTGRGAQPNSLAGDPTSSPTPDETPQPGSYSPSSLPNSSSGPGQLASSQQTTADATRGTAAGVASAAASDSRASGAASGAAGQQAASRSGSPSSGGSGGGQSSPGGAAGQQGAQLSFAPPAAASRGENWAVDKKSPRDIAIRRSVQVIVRGDRLVVLPGREQPLPSAFNQQQVVGATVSLAGPTHSGLDEFVGHVQKQVKDWGMAGQGLYWRPVVKLNVAPDGLGRARDLTLLLDRSGIEVQVERTAALPPTDQPRTNLPASARRKR